MYREIDTPPALASRGAVVESVRRKGGDTVVVLRRPAFVQVEAEEAADGQVRLVAVAGGGVIAEEGDGVVEELLLDGEGEGLDAPPVRLRKARQHRGGPGELRLADLLRPLAQGLNGGEDPERAEPVLEPVGFFPDDRLHV